jgi:hypothetical protein
MSRASLVFLTLAVVLNAACATTNSQPPSALGASAPQTIGGPRDLTASGPQLQGADGDCSDVVTGPATIDASTLVPNGPLFQDLVRGGGRPEMPISQAAADLLREQARLLQPDPDIQNLDEEGLKPFAPVMGISFDSIDASGCCAGGTSVPPDPELSVGPDHIIAVVNTSLEIYDKTGTSLVGPSDLDNFFAPLAGCTGLFDPNTNYDEEQDRFIVGSDDTDAYCLAVSQTGDPTGIWNLYRIPALVAPATLHDYPHAGVGKEGIYIGANQFAGGLVEGRVWAINKADVYSVPGVANPGCVSRSTGFDSTPWPADYHGLPFPSTGCHYLMTEVFDGATHSVWEWCDAFGANTLTKTGDLNLNAASGVTAGFPVDAPQSGGSNIQANDWRGQSTHYRNGRLWMSNQTISCNPGAGTVDCIRWAEIDPDGGGASVPMVVQAGVFATDGEYRTFGSVAVNDCGDMAIGYSKTSTSLFPGTYVTGRLAGDPLGTLQAETTLKAGEVAYAAFDGAPHRWGDYTGMTIDPDGVTFWYLGEYSKAIAGTNWGNYIGSFSFADCCANSNCDNGLFCDGVETCDELGCQAGTAPNCDDGVACTDDSCNEGTDSCDNTRNDDNCANGHFCDGSMCAIALVFEDGFESGDTTVWSSAPALPVTAMPGRREPGRSER